METTQVHCTGVVDGAMFLTADGQTVTLARVRVPRVGLAGGAVMRMLAQRKLQDRQARLEVTGQDAYGNTVAEVWVGGENINDYILHELKDRAYADG